MLKSEVVRNTSSLRFTRRRELVFAQTSDPRLPRIADLMEKLLASLDTLPNPVKDNAPVVGKSRLMELPEFVESLLDIEEDKIDEEDEEPGCIHYDTFQTDCRKGEEEKYCVINPSNEMQVEVSKRFFIFITVRCASTHSVLPTEIPSRLGRDSSL